MKINESLALLQGEQCRRNLYHFVQEFWNEISPEKPVWNWHIKYICDELQASAERVVKRQKRLSDVLINVPPGSSKSSIVSIAFPAWLWTNDPTLKIGTISYSADLATSFSTKSRNIIESDKYKSYFPEIQLTKDTNSKSNYTNTKGGQRIALSTQGKLTGMHFHFLICDDIQNAVDVASETERQNVNEWIGSSLSSRKVDSNISLTIFVQQRLHAYDTTSYLLSIKGKKYKHICLPAELSNIIQPKELAANYKNNLLDPIRLSLEVLKEKKIEMGSKSFNTQYNQNPSDEQDSIIKKEWIPIIEKAKFQEILLAWNGKVPVDFYSDTAYTSDKNNDPSAAISCLKLGGYLYVTNVMEVWEELPDFIKSLHKFTIDQNYTKKSRIVIEPKASGISIIQTLKKLSDLNIIKGKSSSSNKIERLNAVSPTIESGKVILVKGEWNKKVLDQLCVNYPLHDDIRDCIVAAIEEKLIVSKNKGVYHWR